MCEMSQTTGKLTEALAKAQSQIRPAVFDAVNPHFKNRYATLASIMDACKPALSSNGLAIIQAVSVEGDPIRVRVQTILLHISGEFVKSSISMKPVRDDPQSIGSVLTYARRYALSALVGVVADADDDGELATGHAPDKTNVTPIRRKKDPAGNPQPNTPPAADGSASSTSSTTIPPEPAAGPAATGKRRTTERASNQISSRVIKLREIFTASGRLSETPQDMLAVIGGLLQLGRPLKASSELRDDQLDQVLEAYRNRLNDQEKSRQEAA